MPVVRTDGRSVYGHVITKFSRMGSLPHFLTHDGPPRAHRGPCNKLLSYEEKLLRERGSTLVERP